MMGASHVTCLDQLAAYRTEGFREEFISIMSALIMRRRFTRVRKLETISNVCSMKKQGKDFHIRQWDFIIYRLHTPSFRISMSPM